MGVQVCEYVTQKQIRNTKIDTVSTDMNVPCTVRISRALSTSSLSGGSDRGSGDDSISLTTTGAVRRESDSVVVGVFIFMFVFMFVLIFMFVIKLLLVESRDEDCKVEKEVELYGILEENEEEEKVAGRKKLDEGGKAEVGSDDDNERKDEDEAQEEGKEEGG